MRNAVEKGPNVKINSPVLFPAAFSRHSQGIMGAAPRTIDRHATHHAVNAVFPANAEADHHHQRPPPTANASSALTSSARPDNNPGANLAVRFVGTSGSPSQQLTAPAPDPPSPAPHPA